MARSRSNKKRPKKNPNREASMQQEISAIEGPRGPLSDDERKRFGELEANIETCMVDAWRAIGRWAVEIKMRRLYREQHATWNHYIRERWGRTRATIERYMKARLVVESIEGRQPGYTDRLERLPDGSVRSTYDPLDSSTSSKNDRSSLIQKCPRLTSQSVALKLSAIEPEKRNQVWSKAVEISGQRKTAPRDVDRAVRLLEASATLRSKSESDVRIDLESLKSEFAAARKALDSLRLNISELLLSDAGFYYRANSAEPMGSPRQSTVKALKSIGEDLKFFSPSAICPHCKGSRCLRCYQLGWIARMMATK